VLAIVVAALLLIGIGYSAGSNRSGAPVAPVTEAPSQAGVGAVRYASVVDLRDAVVKATGYPCPSWKQDDVVTLAAESGSCSDDDVFSIYASDQKLEDQVSTTKELNKMSRDASVAPTPTLVGPNWMVNIPAEWASRVQAGIGGELRAGDETTEPEPERDRDRRSPHPDRERLRGVDQDPQQTVLRLRRLPRRVSPQDCGRHRFAPKQGTVEVSYSITGGEGPIQGTFTITLGEDPQVKGQDEESTQTPSSSAKLKIKITDVEYTE
jgi:hypothetical protein